MKAYTLAFHSLFRDGHWSFLLNIHMMHFVVVQSLSHVRLFATSLSMACQAPLSSTISRSLLQFMSIDSVMLLNHLIFCLPPSSLALKSFPASDYFPVNQLYVRWPKYWSFSFRGSPSSECSGLISFRIDSDLLAVQGTLKSSLALQFESTNSSVFSLLCGPTLTSIHDY